MVFFHLLAITTEGLCTCAGPGCPSRQSVNALQIHSRWSGYTPTDRVTSRLLKSDYSRDVTHYLSVMHKGEQGAVATVEEGAPVL